MQKSEIKSDKPIFSGNFFLIQRKATPSNKTDCVLITKIIHNLFCIISDLHYLCSLKNKTITLFITKIVTEYNN